MVEISDASPEDVARVAALARPEHVREIRDASGMDAPSAIRLSALGSTRVFAGRAGGKALFLAGAARKPLLSETGSVWMVATPEIDGCPLEAAEAIRGLFGRARELTGAKRLEQFVPAWYGKGIKFLRWLGWREEARTRIRGVEHLHMVYDAEDAQ